MKRIAIWSHPRSRSTALERAFIEREDFFVVHEPFSMSRYKGSSENDIYCAITNFSKTNRFEVLDNITYTGADAQRSDRFVIKDFPYHSLAAFDALVYSGFESLFLVRDPHETISSWQRVHPEFEREELGYCELLYAMRRAKYLTDGAPLMIKSEDLVRKPQETMMRICLHFEIDYRPAMVDWKKRPSIRAWKVWEKYHIDASKAGGIVKNNFDIGELTKRNKEFYESILPIYQQILDEFESEVTT